MIDWRWVKPSRDQLAENWTGHLRYNLLERAHPANQLANRARVAQG